MESWILRAYCKVSETRRALSPSYTFPILATIHHDSSQCDIYCKLWDASGWLIQQKFWNPYDVSRRSYGISTNPLRFMTVLLHCYYDATTVLLQQCHAKTVGQSYCIHVESGWIWMRRGWIVMTNDTPINPDLPRMTTNTTTVPLGVIPIPLR